MGLISRYPRTNQIREKSWLSGCAHQADQNYIVSTAKVLRDYLTKKGYKCADDPALMRFDATTKT